MQLATCWPLHGKVPSQSDYLYLVLPRRPSRELLGSSAKPLTTQARGHHSRGRGVGQSGGRQLPPLKRGGGRCFLQGFGTRRRLADGGIKRQWGLLSCESCRDAWLEAPRSPARLPAGLVWGQEMLQERLPARTPHLGWNNGVTHPPFSCCLNSRGSRCGGGRCRRGPEKGAPPLPWVTKGFAPRPLASGGSGLSGLPGLAARTRGPEGWEQASCPVLPKQCSSTRGLASAFVIYLKFKSVPGPSGRGEGCQEPGWRREGGREARLPLYANLAPVPEPCTPWRCRVWAPLGSCSRLGRAGGDSGLGWVSIPEARVWCLMFSDWRRREQWPC